MSLKVAINAQILPGTGAGGIEWLLIGLVNALGRLEGPEEYVIIGPWENPDWLKPHLAENQRIVRGPKSQAFKRALAPLRPLVRAARRTRSWVAGSNNGPQVVRSNGFYEKLGCSVIHFPYQQFIASDLPAVFDPFDLQHIHYPQFFSKADFQWRESTYSAACRAAHTVVVHSEWVKRDIMEHYQIGPEKMQTILSPPPTQVYSEPAPHDVSAIGDKYSLPGKFALYPAMTWEHKNHLRLLEALALLRDRHGVRVELVCTGHQNDFFRVIQQKHIQLQLNEQVRFLGMVPHEDLRALYRLAQFTVLPSLFEGAGLPLVEAWNEGSPVACADTTSLGEHAGDGALLFDPMSAENIAEAIHKMAADPALRERLTERGFARLRKFNWETTAKAYRAVYRRAANRTLTEEDQWSLTLN
jgi:glycosyltransferase involved in cell wall biosynthesis